jgi:hypothetical protein
LRLPEDGRPVHEVPRARFEPAREPEFIAEEDATGAAYFLKLFLADGPIGTWQDASP